MSALTTPITRDTAADAVTALESLWLASRGRGIELDLSQVTYVDSAGVAILAGFARRAERHNKALRVTGLVPSVAAALALFPFPETVTVSAAAPLGVLERTGAWMEQVAQLALEFTILCADVVWFTIASLWRRRGIRWQAVLMEMYYMGSQALGVVGLIAFLVGATISLQSAAQLRTFGANLFVADLIGVSITRELGPLITAIVVAGRSGSAVAAEIATMMITEEIDALRTMGLNPTRFLIVPKVIAIALTQPLLTVMANVLAIFGGFLVAVTYLDVSPGAFINRLQTAVQLKDVLTGLFKSILFANLIVTIGALCGLRTHGGADAVGRSTTTSVVAAIFAIIVADALCSLIFYFGA